MKWTRSNFQSKETGASDSNWKGMFVRWYLRRRDKKNFWKRDPFFGRKWRVQFEKGMFVGGGNKKNSKRKSVKQSEKTIGGITRNSNKLYLLYNSVSNVSVGERWFCCIQSVADSSSTPRFQNSYSCLSGASATFTSLHPTVTAVKLRCNLRATYVKLQS